MRYRFARQSPNFPKPMVALNLMVDAPAHILAGLSNGSLERIGGVVRDVDTKQVVMWLRDTGATPANTLLGMTTAASLLHVGVAVVGFAIVIDKLNQIEKTLQLMQAQLNNINYKIDLGFYANFRAAVNLAQNAFSMQRSDNRQVSAMAAINRFLEAQHIYTDLIDQQLPYKSAVITSYLQTLYLAYLMEARCYLELEELDTAVQRFQFGHQEINKRLRQYVDILLTEKPIIYLHPKLSPEVDLTRLTRIFQWKNQAKYIDENTTFELLRNTLNLDANYDVNIGNWIDALPPAIVTQSDIQRNLFGMTTKGRDKVFSKLKETIGHIESLIETDQRFLGYGLGVQALQAQGVSFQEFQSLQAQNNFSGEVVYLCPAEAG